MRKVMTEKSFKRVIRQIKASAEAVQAVGKAMSALAAGGLAVVVALQILIHGFVIPPEAFCGALPRVVSGVRCGW
jgi:hypothetical protein